MGSVKLQSRKTPQSAQLIPEHEASEALVPLPQAEVRA